MSPKLVGTKRAVIWQDCMGVRTCPLHPSAVISNCAASVPASAVVIMPLSASPVLVTLKV